MMAKMTLVDPSVKRVCSVDIAKAKSDRTKAGQAGRGLRRSAGIVVMLGRLLDASFEDQLNSMPSIHIRAE